MIPRPGGMRSRITLAAFVVTAAILGATGIAVVSAMRELLVDDLATVDAGARAEVTETTNELTAVLVVVLPVVTLALAGSVWWLVGRTLRPVEAIRSEVAGISNADLHRRVPVPGTGDEIDRLVTTMNAMLARLQEGRDRQVRFVADASHELRTPVTRMITQVEVDTAHPGTADPAASVERMLADLRGLQALVDDLLILARADAEEGAPPADPVDLDDVVLEEVARVPRRPGLQIDAGSVASVRVTGDRGALARVVRNLLDNAVRHARALVTVELRADDRSAVLTVDDDGPGIPPEARETVFDRFTRVEQARGGSTGGTGLGLTIVRDVVTRHGGRVTVADAPSHPGARLTVILPRSGVGEAGPRDQTAASDRQRDTAPT